MKEINRVLIETMVRKALKDIKDAPERSTRNLLDLGLIFAKGRFQKQFLQIARDMMNNEDSVYYRLVVDIVAHVQHDRILTFGMNVGYNSCTLGADIIRRIEKEQKFVIPWSLTLEIDSDKYLESPEAYDTVIRQGKDIGIFTWMLFADKAPETVFPLVTSHKDCAFIIFCSPECITESFTEAALQTDNLMIAVQYSDGAESACRLLRLNELLYSVYVPYSGEDEREILSGEIFSCTEALNPVFTAFAAKPGCSEEYRKKIYNHIVEVRSKMMYRTIPWDVFYDVCSIDGVISDVSCSASFDRNGCLYKMRDKYEKYNLFLHELREILQFSFPRDAIACS